MATDEQVKSAAAALDAALYIGERCPDDGGISLANFAHSVAVIMTDPAGSRCRLWCGAGMVSVVITASTWEGHPEWDQVSLNGIPCGNRSGAREVYTAVCYPFINRRANGCHHVTHRDAARVLAVAIAAEVQS